MKFRNVTLSNIINWCSVFLWAYYLLGAWTFLPLPQLISKYEIIYLSFILCLQILNNTDFKTLLRLKNWDFNLMALIILISAICLTLSHSRIGAIFNIANFCMIWYLSDKWSLNSRHITLLWISLILILIRWVIIPAETNSNTVSSVCYLSLIAVLAGINFFISNYKTQVCLEIPCIIVVFFQIVKFRGRGSLIALLSYVIIRFIFSKQLKESFKFYKFICIVLTLGSLIFVFIYTGLWKMTGSDWEMPIFRKPIFSGREAIWYELWGIFKNQPFIGTGSNLVLESWQNVNIHNSIYNILIIYGIIVFTFAMILLLTKLFHLWNLYHTKNIFITVISGIFAVFLECFFEMNLFWTPVVFLWLFLPALLNVRTVNH